MVSINDQLYEYVDNITIFDFIRLHDIFLPTLDDSNSSLINLSCVEVKGIEDVVDAKATYLEDEMIIHTNTQKVYSYLHDVITSNKEALKRTSYKKIVLNPNEYNILLCQPECYLTCLKLYKNVGFNDIVSTKLGHMIISTEICQKILDSAVKKYDHLPYDTTVIMLQSIIELPKKYQINIKPACEISAQLIKNYYQEILHIKKKINIIYVTKSVIGLITHYGRIIQYGSFIDNIVFLDYFDVEKQDNSYDGLITKAMYIDNSTNLCTSSNYNVIFKMLNQMDFKEQSIEISTIDYGKEVIATYEGMVLKFLFTDLFLTTSEIEQLDYDAILIKTSKQTMHINQDDGYLLDYNLNYIYRKLLVRPGYKNIFKRFE